MGVSSRPHVIDAGKIRAVPIQNLPRHDVIYALRPGLDGKIYLGVSSEFSAEGFGRLMAYDPATDCMHDLVDLKRLLPEANDVLRPPHSKIHTTLCVGRDGTIWFATHITAPPRGEHLHRIWEILDDPVRGFTGSHVISYHPGSGQVRDHGIIIHARAAAG